MSRDWKDTLKQIQVKKTGTVKPRAEKMVQKNPLHHLKKVVTGYLKVHPRDMLIKLSPHFNTIIYANSGGWPDETGLEVTPDFLMENIGDLIKVVVVKNDCLLMRTNRGYFKFINK